MKRKSLLILAVIVLIIFAVLKALVPSRDSHAPRFVPGAPASIAPFKWNHYEWMANAPFENHRMWLWTAAGNKSHTYLYDLRQRAVVGELFNASVPELCSRDGSRLLLLGFEQ